MDDGSPPIETPRQFELAAELGIGIEEAFELLGSPQGMERWVPLCRGVSYEHPPGASGLSVGSVRTIRMAGGMSAVEKILLVEPPCRLDYTVRSIGIPLDSFLKDYRGVTRLERLGDGRTGLRWAIHFQCVGPTRPLAPLYRAMFRATVGSLVKGVCRASNGRML